MRRPWCPTGTPSPCPCPPIDRGQNPDRRPNADAAPAPGRGSALWSNGGGRTRRLRVSPCAFLLLLWLLLAGPVQAGPLSRAEIAPLVLPPYALGEPVNDMGVWNLLNSGFTADLDRRDCRFRPVGPWAVLRMALPAQRADDHLGADRGRDWITPRAECGSPCRPCRVRCKYGAIKAAGAIRYSECFQCLDASRSMMIQLPARRWSLPHGGVHWVPWPRNETATFPSDRRRGGPRPGRCACRNSLARCGAACGLPGDVVGRHPRGRNGACGSACAACAACAD
jgi:hypothetical protein